MTCILLSMMLFVALDPLFLSPKSLNQNGLVSRTTNIIDIKKIFSDGVLTDQIRIVPVRLKIPSISADIHIEYVGLTSDGAMDVPKDQTNGGWFFLGPRPGENGSAVIAGHYGWKNSKSSAFDNLYKLQEGDTLYVEDNKGESISFIVREIRSYNPEADASDVFNSDDGKSHLNLITCDGLWNKVFKSYSKRLVVFTDKVISDEIVNVLE